MLEENVFTDGPWETEKPGFHNRRICRNRVGFLYWRNIAVYRDLLPEEQPEFLCCVYDFT